MILLRVKSFVDMLICKRYERRLFWMFYVVFIYKESKWVFFFIYIGVYYFGLINGKIVMKKLWLCWFVFIVVWGIYFEFV